VDLGSIKITYTYDAAGRLVETRDTEVSSVPRVNITYKSNSSTGNATSQINTWKNFVGSGARTYTYAYDANGNITSINDGDYTITYVYDAANQLIRENNPRAGKTWTWTYDDAGNITSRKRYAYTDSTLGSVLETVNYTYDSTWGDLLTGYGGKTISSDTIGNMTNDGTWSYSWRNGRELYQMTSGSTTWTYTYDGDGMRTKRTNGSVTYNYTYNGGQLMRMTKGSHVMDIYYDELGPKMLVSNTYGTFYYMVNAQGDVAGLVNSSGVRVVEYHYDAWGNLLSTTGSGASGIGAENPLRYRGYVYDTETGLYYLQSRYYDPEMGRFISSDNYPSTGQNLTGHNMFAYCGNNPVTRSDVSGGAWETVFDIISLGTSIIEVAMNPADVGAWVGLVGDIIDVAVPFVAGVGETVRAVNVGRKVADAADDVNDTRKVVSKIHGNSLSSNKINYGYQLIDKNNNILKYGESKNPLTRYSQKWLDENGYKVQIKVAGTKRGVHEWQHDMIENYAIISGGRPRLNNSMW